MAKDKIYLTEEGWIRQFYNKDDIEYIRKDIADKAVEDVRKDLMEAHETIDKLKRQAREDNLGRRSA